LRVAEVADRLASCQSASVPLLVFRLPALEQTAWRNGLRAARALERRVNAAFATAVARVLRADDLLAHDAGTDAFVVALLAPMRDGQSAAPFDVRSALARIATTVETRTRLDVDAGWTHVDAREPALDAAIARALVRGAQERERYAFFSAVGHELRTPLASIRGYLETLAEDEVDGATRRRFVRIAYNETLRLARLLEGMFEISMLDLSAALPRAAGGRLDLALAGVADACAATAAARAVTLSIPALDPIPVAIDGEQLALVLINLVDNALKHGRRGGRVSVSVDLAHRRAVTIAVDDDGPGIAPADRERIFGLGQRGATAAHGSGIGLALVRLIVERAGGRVEAGVAPGGGARFTVCLQRARSAGRYVPYGAQHQGAERGDGLS
jgi:signal transduction histidine kinase